MPDYPYAAEHPFYHGSADPLSDILLPGNECRWWNIMDHRDYLSPPWTGGDDGELGAELRTAYGNQVYEAFLSSESHELKTMAEEFGLTGLGARVGIIFVTADRDYVERYGEAYEIDMEADGILDVLPDENASRESWLIVMRAGAPFPFKSKPAVRLSGPKP